MKQINSLAPSAALILLLFAGHALPCAPIQEPAKLAKDWPRDNYFLLYQPGDDKAVNETSAKILEKVRFRYFERTNIQLLNLPARSGKGSLFLLAPRGRVIASHEGPITEKLLDDWFASPGRSRIAASFSDSLLISVVRWKSERKELDAKNLAVLKAVQKQFKDLEGPRMAVVDIDPNDPREALLVRSLNLEMKELTPAVTVLMWNARPANTFYNELDQESLFTFIQDTYSQAAHTVLPTQYGESVLIYWKEP